MNVLNEKLSDVIYHVTYPDSAYSILSEDRFTLTYATSVEKHFQPQKKQYYMSFARSITGGYFIDTLNDSYYTGVIFELNGKALSTNYSGGPIDYFSKSAHKGTDETEDRLYSEKPYIDGVSRYITAVYVVMPVVRDPLRDFKSPFTVKEKEDVGRIGVNFYSKFLKDAISLTKLTSQKGIPVVCVPIPLHDQTFLSKVDFYNAWKRKEKQIKDKKFLLYLLSIYSLIKKSYGELPKKEKRASDNVQAFSQEERKEFLLSISLMFLFFTSTSKKDLIDKFERHLKVNNTLKQQITALFTSLLNEKYFPSSQNLLDSIRNHQKEGRIGAAFIAFLDGYLTGEIQGLPINPFYTLAQIPTSQLVVSKGAMNTRRRTDFYYRKYRSIRAFFRTLQKKLPAEYSKLDKELFGSISTSESAVFKVIVSIFTKMFEKLN